MKLISTVIIAFSLSFFPLIVQENCLTKDSLIQLDASWEKAQLELDLNHIDSILAEDYIWVHNHANTIDDKKAVLDRIKRYLNVNTNDTKSRVSKDVNVIISGSTGIISGFTVIDRGLSPITYHFMRTYVKINNKCYQIANHTMALPDEKED
ncbi:nuclear transport factor 2 family protein [Winogradskyella sp. A3E31]|uniref:nuclear transport factor 2 family protein n=1 Tax=Winogradskyella sp. A3E31 TaxID=3349637 RepID=UPI00398A7E40